VFETKKNIALSSIQGDLVVETLMRGLLYLFFKRTFFRHFCAPDLIYSGRKVVTCGLIRTNDLLLRMSSSKLKMMENWENTLFGKNSRLMQFQRYSRLYICRRSIFPDRTNITYTEYF